MSVRLAPLARLGAALCLLARVAAAQPSAQDAKAAREHYKKGEQLIKQQRFDEAIAELETAYKLDPQQEHLYNLGVAHHLRGDDAIAVEYYRLFLIDAPANETARKATTYLTSLEKKLVDAQSEKTKKDIEAAQAEATRSGNSASTAEMLVYAQYMADAEAKERKAALIDDEINAGEAEIAKQEARVADEHKLEEAVLARSQRWEHYARSAPSGGGTARRITGSVLMALGTAGATMGVQDILAREQGSSIDDYASYYIAAGGAVLVLGIVLVASGSSAASDPRPSWSFQLTPTVSHDAGGLSLGARF